MKHFNLLMASILAMLFGGGVGAFAQTDVTSQYLDNADFSQSTPVTVNVCGYKADISKSANKLNGQDAVYWAQDVDGWTVASTKKDNNAGAVFAYGSEPKLCGNSKSAPATNPDGEATGNALGFFAVWGGTIQYTQAAKTSLAIGHYDLTYTYYNQSGEKSVTNLIGFVEDGGTTHYGSNTTFTVGAWTTVTISFDLTAETSGKFSIGYKTDNNDSGSGKNPMLFIDNITLKYTDPNLAKAKAELKATIDEATAINSIYDDATLKSAIETAQSVYDTATLSSDVESAQATLESALPEKKTDLVANASFEGETTTVTTTSGGNQDNPASWTNSVTWASGAWNYSTTSTDYYTDGAQSFKVRFNWASTAYSLTQTLPSLPAGKYAVLADVRGTTANGSKVEAGVNGGTKVTVPTNAFTIVAGVIDNKQAADYNLSLDMTYTTGSNSSEGIFYWDNVRVYLLQEYTADEALAAAKETLNSTITTATTYNTVLGNPTLTAAIATAQTTYDSSTSTDDVTAAATTLNTALDGVRTIYVYDAANKLFLSRGDSYGTMATTDKYGVPFTLTLSGDAFKLVAADWDGNVGLGSNLYTDNSSPAAWTATVGTDGVKLSNDGKYLKGATESGAAISTTTTDGEATAWTMKAIADRNDIVNAYVSDNYSSVAAKANISGVTGDNFLSKVINNTDEYASLTASTIEPTAYTFAKPANGRNDANSTSPREAFQSVGTFTYTATGLEEGIYKVTVPAFFRNGGNAWCVSKASDFAINSTAYVIANGEQVRVKGWAEDRVSDTNPNSVNDAKAAFQDGKYVNEVYCYVGSDGQLSLTVAVPSWQGSGWFIFGTTTLTRYAGLVATYQAALDAAKAALANTTDYGNVTGSEKTALENAISTYGNVTSGYQAATTALATATTAFTAAKEAYDNYANNHADADNIANALGVTVTAPTTAAEATAYFDNLNVAEFNAVKTGYANDLTKTYDTDWTVTGFETKTGAHWSGNTAEYLDHWNAGSEAISATKTITLPAGKWVLKASGRSNVIAGTFTMKAGDATVAFPSKGGSGLGITTDGEASFDESKTYATTGGRGWEWRFLPLTLTEKTEVTVTIAANLDNSWAGFSDFAILADDATVAAVEQEAYEAALAAAKAVDQTQPMNGDVKTALTDALTTYGSVTSNYTAATTALQTATTNATASIAAYATAKATLDGRATLIATTNVYTADALATYYTTPKAAYDAGTLTDDEAKALTNPYDYHFKNDTQTNAFMGSAFGVTSYDEVPYVNTWSTEGNDDGSNFKWPFYEYWVASGSTLADKTLTATMTGLTAGQKYKLTADVRVQVSSAPATGITIDLNGGNAVTVTGKAVGSNNLYLDTYKVIGTADEDGTVKVNFNVAGTNVNWLAFQNLKVEETTAKDAYEEALAAAQAALANTDYANVTGEEKTALETAVNAEKPTTDDGYTEATTALITATSAFTAAKEAYDNYANNHAAAEAIATALGVSDSYFTVPTTAAGVTAYFDNLNVAEFNAVKTGYANDLTKTYDTDWASNTFGSTNGQHWSGNADTKYMDKWNGSAATYTATKTLTLPAGKWVLMAAGRGAKGTTLTMEAGGTTVTFPSKSDTGYGITTDGTASFEAPVEDGTYANGNAGRGWEWRFIPLTLTEETEVTVTVTGKVAARTWVGFSDFTILTDDANKATFDDLNAAITAAEAHTLGFDEGEYAPYNNVDALKALAAAKAIDQTAYNTKDDVKTVTDALTAATWTANTEEVNALCDGDFSEAALSANSGEANDELQKFGWTAATGLRLIFDNTYTDKKPVMDDGQKALFAWAGTAIEYGKQVGYTMPLAAHTIYELTFDYASWTGTAAKVTATVLNGNGEGLSGYVTSAGQEISTGLDHARMVFTTGDDAADYILTLTGSGNIVVTNIRLIRAVPDEVTFDDAATAAPEANVYANVTYQRTLYTGWNSIVLPFDATLTELGAEKAYSFAGTAKVDGKDNSYTINLTSVDDGTLKANTPYIVKMTADKTDGLSFTGKAISPAESLTAEDGTNHAFSFQGTYVAYGDKAADNPILKGDYIVDEAGFVKAAGGNQIGAFRAWLDNADETGAAKIGGFTIDGEEVTGIRAIELESVFTGKAYNLQGQQVENPRHGVFIINGRKVVVK